jgi:formate hydrogenlyase transcriptional activator
LIDANAESHFDVPVDVRRYQALLELTDLMVHHGSLPDLLHELAARLHKVISFEIASFSLYDARHDLIRLHIWEGKDRQLAAAEVPVGSSPSGWAVQQQQPLVIDLRNETRFPAMMPILLKYGVQSYCVLPLTVAQHRLGALGLGTSQAAAYTEERDVEFLRRVAELVALTLEGRLMARALEEERDRLKLLLNVNSALVTNLDLHELFPAISEHLRRVIKQDYASLAIHGINGSKPEMYAPDFPGDKTLGADESLATPGDQLAEPAVREREIRTYNRADMAGIQSGFVPRILEEGIQSLCCVPLITPKGALGTLNLGSLREGAFSVDDYGLLQQVAAQVAIALDNARAYREIELLKNKLAEEELYLEDEIRSELGFEELVGEAAAFKLMLGQAKIVAACDATVLILGETGTGKELVARAIHRMSNRRDNSFIKMNCAAIPTGLLESELFGHEKGAFTGAISQKVGRLELADKGTIFLDEVGDIPLELQPKLLRVLQDQEFERLGSNKTMRVNVRLIAATNRDLAKSVAEREFRSDLYYRLRVFPIHIPPLRERRGDIPLLVRYFVQKFARRMNKQIDTIPGETLNALTRWGWPGNVRELENIVERSVILTGDTVLRVPLAGVRAEPQAAAVADDTLEAAEREHIIRMLRDSRGVISGPHGAARKLGLKRTTLQSKMNKLGISRRDYSQ